MVSRPELTSTTLPCSGRRIPRYFLRTSLLSLFCVLILFSGICAAASTKNNQRESPNALQLVLNSPMKQVLEAVQEVAGDQVIYGTQSYQRERNLTGAHPAESSSAFDDTSGTGKVLYKVADGVLSPTNFKNSGDMGTITVRYVITAFDEKSTNLRIDAVFIENTSRKVHESDGSVEAAEFGEIRQHLETIAAKVELEKDEEARIARERQEKQSELDLMSRQDAAAAAKRTATAPIATDLEKRVAQLRKQAEVRVRASGTQLKTAPYKGASNIQSLAPYTDVVVLILTPYWYGVQTVDGHRGWVHRSEVEAVP